MSKTALRLAELIALWSIAAGSLAVAAYMIHLNRTGEAFGALIGLVPLAMNRIGNMGQAQVMNAMAEFLAKSHPVDPGKSEEN